MNLKNDIIFKIAEFPIYWGEFLILLGFLILFVLFYLFFNKYGLPFLSKDEKIELSKQRKVRRILFSLLSILWIYFIITILQLDIVFFKELTLQLILEILIIIVFSYLILWFVSNVFIHRFYVDSEKEEIRTTDRKQNSESRAKKTVGWLLFLITVLVLMRYIDWDYTAFTIKSPKEGAGDVLIKISSILTSLIVFLFANLFIWIFTQILLYSFYYKKQFDQGVSYSINKLIAYLVYFVATIVALKTLGTDIGLLLGGTAALLVGVGLALQSTFADFFSGLVLLFERPIKVGDYVYFDDETVHIQKIGLRVSKVKNRDSINFIIPNSKLITQTVINLSHDEKSVRFNVVVGVAYGSDTELVKRLLLEAATVHKDVLKRPTPNVLFKDFANSALEFQLYYYSKELFNAELVKSDIRFTIDHLFRENKVTIPFPQRDVWTRSYNH